MIFKVKVMCIGQKPGSKRKLMRTDIVALIESENLDTVMADGASYAEGIVPSDTLWREFTTLSASMEYPPWLLSITPNAGAEPIK